MDGRPGGTAGGRIGFLCASCLYAEGGRNCSNDGRAVAGGALLLFRIHKERKQNSNPVHSHPAMASSRASSPGKAMTLGGKKMQYHEENTSRTSSSESKSGIEREEEEEEDM